ncbi:helicase-exonuclease AddAB subunit AddA [Clostridium sp.]|uniref:helicase-exonuclease AddAB subunit AddA n=1 Tax=Clostridium sp. TaxID=1506 RepID=UPI00290AB764|nr:helicase-exonuclease AddAB subunit AddA [Clostridium sp.]MDU3526189.1 helicase-exonuclease AddAB subunit AddA [Clostridium sp.]MDU3548310.1 helicase-exonuclease AddAB subunit AddA [Clostridium sp.]MDU6363574.1 helicase-exonuclease AddAB subunit AddA [Clostridium sp.]
MGDTKWTDDQLKAITTRGCNLLVAAAAGSGKTAVLVERIIRIITNENNPVDIDRLLVVTFTSAAAAEMRERIAAAISRSLEANPNSKVLQRQLTLLSRANITTMHSFCLDVIKNYYHVIDLDPTFRIADETENTLLKLEVINDMFEDYYESENIGFRNLIEAYSGSRDDQRLKDIILDLYRFSMSGPWPDKWLVNNAERFNIETIDDLNKTIWIDILKETINIEVNGYIKMLEKAIGIIRDTEGLEPYEATFLDDLDMFKSIEESLSLGIEELYSSINNISFSRLKSVKKDKVSDEESLEIVKGIRDSIKKKTSKLIEDSFSMTVEDALNGIKNSYPYMKMISQLTLEFINRFKEKKRERNILDFNDLEHLCLKILIENDEEDNIHPSSVAKGFREYFDEVLVDEYQDSNNVQEAIIDLVSRKTLENPNVFMVGDVKQSIYRFRQAKPELFLDKYNRYPLEDGDLNRKIQLYKNFRSREEVISGVNYIFKEVMSKTVGELEYNDDEALNLGANYKENNDENTMIAGPIELHILDKSGEYTTEVEEYDGEGLVEEEEDIDSIGLEARIVARRIKELLNSDPKTGKVFKVLDKETGEYRPLKYKDIVILLRATRNWSEIFLEEIGSEGIPVYADTGTGYFETIEIRTMMSLLKVIDNPMQDVPMISVLRSPLVSFSAEELGDIRLLDKEKYFYEIIKGVSDDIYEVNEELKNKCKVFIKNLGKWRNKSIYTPIDEFIWYLYMDTAYYGYVGAMPNGKLRQANLKILFQRAKQFEQTSFKGLFNFINFINKLRNSSGDMGSAKILGENEDVVRIMSIHKSKGLEFPVVFTCGFGKQFNLMDLNKSILYHDDLGLGPDYVDLERRNSYSTLAKEAIKKKILFETLSEEMRILYVAFTRAKEKLIITGATRNLEKSISRWASSAALDDEIVPASEVLKGKSYLDWIGMAICKHRDGEELRKYIGANNSSIINDFSTWKTQMWTKKLLAVEKNEVAVDENEETDLFINSDVEHIDKEIERRLNYKYKYDLAGKLPSNVSVSDLKRSLYNNENDDVITVNIFSDKEVLKPKFLQEKRGLSASERGTIAHFIMQKLDLNKVNTKEEIDTQIYSMKDKNLLTEEEIKAVQKISFISFFKSNLGKRLLNAFNTGKLVKRELPFYTEISSLNIDNTLSEEVYGNENVRLQGIIDCIFEEEDKIILLDYKTDYVEHGKESEILDKYKIQIKYYKDAVEKITGKEVKECYLYLFGLNKEEKMNL